MASKKPTKSGRLRSSNNSSYGTSTYLILLIFLAIVIITLCLTFGLITYDEVSLQFSKLAKPSSSSRKNLPVSEKNTKPIETKATKAPISDEINSKPHLSTTVPPFIDLRHQHFDAVVRIPNSSKPNKKNSPLVDLHFIHVPKCGGTSMTAVLRQIVCAIDNVTNSDCCTNPGFCDWWAHRRCAAIRGCTDHFPQRYGDVFLSLLHPASVATSFATASIATTSFSPYSLSPVWCVGHGSSSRPRQ